MQSLEHIEVLSILVCINRYTLEFPQLLLANILHQLISFNFGVRVEGLRLFRSDTVSMTRSMMNFIHSLLISVPKSPATRLVQFSDKLLERF